MALNARRTTKIARTLEAADLLAAEGISALVLHVPTLKPLDAEAIVAAADRTGLGYNGRAQHPGPGRGCAEVMSGHRFTPLLRVGVNGGHVESTPNDELLRKYGRTAWHVADAAWSHLAKWRE